MATMRSVFGRALLALVFVSANTACAAELKILFTSYTPPWVFQDGTGIVVELVRTALESKGHTVVPVYAPIEQGHKLFADKQVDGTTLIRENSGIKAEYSDNFMAYRNRAFALPSRKIVVRDIADLKGKSIIAFQNAHRYLGSEFGRIAAHNPRYKEMAEQENQVHRLLLGETDVAVMDESIFNYYRQKLIIMRKASKEQQFVGYDIFPPTPYQAAFYDRKVRDDFDDAIAAMRKDGRYDAIYRKYTSRFPTLRR